MVQDTKVCWCGLRGRVIAAGQCQLVLMSQLFHEFTQGEIVQFLPLGSFRRIPQRSQPVSHYSEIQLEPLQNLPPRHLLPRQSNLPHNEPLTNAHPEWKYRGTPLLSFLTLDSSLD